MASLQLPTLIRLWPSPPPPVCYTPLLSFLPSFLPCCFPLPTSYFPSLWGPLSSLGKGCVQPQVWLVETPSEELNVPVCFHNTMITCVLACPCMRAGASQYELTRIFLLVPLMTAVCNTFAWESERNCSNSEQMKPVPVHMVRFLLLLLWLNMPCGKIYTYMKECHHIFPTMFFLPYFGKCFGSRDKVNVCLLGCVCEP